jgi:hypothetical protein
VVAWHDNRTGRQQFDVYYQQYDLEGRALGANRKADAEGETSSQSSPNLVTDDTGRFIIVWEDDRGRGRDRDVYLRRFDVAGNAREVSQKANDDIGSTDQIHPAVAMDGKGGFIVAWTDERNAFQKLYAIYDIYFQQYDAAGKPVGPNQKVNEEAGRISDPTTPAVAADANGNFVIAWTDNRIHSWDIYCQRFDASGRALGPNGLVNDDNNYDADQRSPSVAMNSRGDFVIAWMSSQGWVYGVRYQLFDADGHRVGRSQEPYYGIGGDWPVVAMDASGRFAIAWWIDAYFYIDGVSTIISDVNVERFDAEGNSLGRSRKANDVAQGKRGGPSIAMNRSGEFLVAWQDGRNGKKDVYYQRYNSNGSLLGTNQKANDDAGIATPYSPAVVIDETGRFVVAWPDGRMGSESSILMGQGFNADGSRNGVNFRVANGLSDRFPTAASNAEKILFAWQDNRRSKGFDIYAKLTSWDDASAVSDHIILPRNHNLLPNYPNPFNPETSISYSLSASGMVRLSIFDLTGQWVCHLVSREEPAGLHRVVWDGTDSQGGKINSGVYFCRMSVESGGKTYRFTRKLCLVR